jgi:hypothetical protein
LIAGLLWVQRLMNTWDDAKRRRTLVERGLDFADAELVFAGRSMTLPDERRNYREPRYGDKVMASAIEIIREARRFPAHPRPFAAKLSSNRTIP